MRGKFAGGRCGIGSHSGRNPKSKSNQRTKATSASARRIAEILAIAVLFFLAAFLGFRFAWVGNNAPIPPTWGVAGVVGVAVLLTAALLAERAKGEAALRESRARYDALFENLLHGAAVFRVVDDGEDFEFVDYNPAGERIDRVDRQQVVGRRVTDAFPGIREFGLMDVLRRVWRTGEPERFPTAVYADDRLRVWRDSVVYKLPSGEVVSIYRDVTEQVRGKDRFLRQQELMRRVALMSPVGIVSADRDGRITFSNDRAREILGLDSEKMADRTFYSPQWDLADPSGRPLDADELPLARAMATGAPVENVTLSVRRGDGRQIILSVNASPLFSPDEDGIDGAVATFEDVTERRRAEEMLRESEARFRAVFDNTLNAILVADDDSRYVDANPAACDMTGYDRDELLSMSLWDLGATKDPADARAAWEAFLAEGKGSGLFPLRKKDGSVITAEFRATAHILPGIHLSVLNDVTDRVRSEEALRESEARFRQIAGTIEDVFFLNDLENKRVIYVNPAYERVFGRRVADLLADPADFLRPVHPDDRERMAASYQRKLSGEPVEATFRIIRGGDDLRWIHSKIFPIRDADGRVRRSAGLATDITARKRQEEQLMQADKMISLGTLVAGVAHEINNPIGFMALITPTLRSAWETALPILDAHDAAEGIEVDEMPWADLREEMPGLLDGMENGVRRIRTIVEHLSRFSRDQSITLSAEIDLNAVLDASLALLENPIRKATRRLSVDQAPNLPLIRGNFQRLEQVMVNLILNACHALPDLDKALEIRTGGDAGGGRAVLTIRDEGVGIPPENLKRVRDPFFTTRRDRGGAGLGLAITARIVEQHDGQLDIRSEPGRGTTVELSFPSSETNPKRTASP